jgi:hypothetical protein
MLPEKQVKTNKEISKFYSRVNNKTDITFSNKKYDLLNKGLKYNLHYKGKEWIKNLSLDISCLINIEPRFEILIPSRDSKVTIPLDPQTRSGTSLIFKMGPIHCA